MNDALDSAVSTRDIQAAETAHIVQTYRRVPVAFVRGRGVYLYDAEGREFVDFISGIGVAALGHAHPGFADALADQWRTLVHTSNLYFHPLQGQLATALARLSGLPRAFICNSGTEANEACLKFARRYWVAQGEPERTGIVALDHAFGGRTCGSLSITWDAHYRDPFMPMLIPSVTFVSPNDPDALLAAVSSQTMAIVAEPIQGEGGVRPLTPAFAEAIRQACARSGALYLADEVQCGMGRTGQPFHFPALGLTPDLVSVGKALGGGYPIGAALLSERVASAIAYGDHGTTYGGNPAACRAALFVIDRLEQGLLAHVRAIGAVFERKLRAIAARHTDLVREVRGKGLMWGLDLQRDASPVTQAALSRGLLVNRTSETVVRMLPPYIVSEAEVDRGLALLDAALSDAAAAERKGTAHG